MHRPMTLLPLLAALVAWMPPAVAKLPPLSPEAKAKADETAAKAAWTDKVGAFKLCRSMERTAEFYRTSLKSQGREAPAALPTPPCADPGPFAAAASAPKPLEASGAHSPPQTATSPPGSKATEADLKGSPKK